MASRKEKKLNKLNYDPNLNGEPLPYEMTPKGRNYVPKTPVLTDRDIDDEDMKTLEESGLTKEFCLQNGVFTAGNDDQIESYLGYRRDNFMDGGLLFLFHDVQGNETGYARFKPRKPSIIKVKNGKERVEKYLAPTGETNKPYIPVGQTDQLLDLSTKVLENEGEKKILKCAFLLPEYANIGFTGIACWNVPKTNDFLPEIKEIPFEGREVIIISDAEDNATATKRSNLECLKKSKAYKALGARSVKRVITPADVNGKKQGIDDYLWWIREDKQREVLLKLLDTATEVDQTKVDVVVELEEGTLAYAMAHNPDIIDEIEKDLETVGVVGEENLALGIYLIGTSRIQDDPGAAIVQGPSATGKSYTIGKVVSLFPESCVMQATGISRKSLQHNPNLQHKFIVCGERAHGQSPEQRDQTSDIRQLRSEKFISYWTTEQGPDGKWRSVQVIARGPVAMVESTTLDSRFIFGEDLNRALFLHTDHSEDQTIRINDKIIKDCQTSKNNVKILEIQNKHHQFQQSLVNIEVLVPFADQVINALPTGKVEVRRLSGQIISLIKTVALLHQYQRKRTEEGSIIAEKTDFDIAWKILAPVIEESLGVDDNPQKLLIAMKKCLIEKKKEEKKKDRLTTGDVIALGKELGFSCVTCRNYLKKLVLAGLLEKKKGKGTIADGYVCTEKKWNAKIQPLAETPIT